MFSLVKNVCNRRSVKLMVDCCKQYGMCTTFINNKLDQSFRINNNLQSVRMKSKGPKKKEHVDSGYESKRSDDDILDMIQDRNTKTLKVNVTSLRVDGILKSALGLARNKVETLFYESKIRINGEKVLKKSATVNEGDEIDVIKNTSPNNPNFLIVARVEILSVTGEDEQLVVKIRRCKALTVENFKDKWQA